MEIVILIAIGVLLVVVVTALVSASKRVEEQFKERVAQANSERSLNFATEPMLGFLHHCVVFDRTNQKVLYISSKNCEVLEYDYFTRWSSHFDLQRDGGVKRCRIVLDTTDFDRPQMTFFVRTQQQANEWVARLDVVFNRE